MKTNNQILLRLLGALLVAALLGVGCDDGDPCGGYEADYEALVAGAQACSVAADCQVLQVDCQMMDRCSEYVNLSLTAADLDRLTDAWKEMECGGAGGHSCCDGADLPSAVVCLDGQCAMDPDSE